MTRCFILTTLALAAALPALSMAQTPPAIKVQDAWSRATPPQTTTGVVYLTLTSPTGDKLVGVSSPAAAAASLHRTERDGTIMRMRAVTDGLALPPGRPVTLAPNGDHVMLEGLKAPLVAGQSFPLRLSFQTAPPLEIKVTIRRPGEAAGSMDEMPGMAMDH